MSRGSKKPETSTVATASSKKKTWDDVELDDPTPDEVAIFEAYEAKCSNEE